MKVKEMCMYAMFVVLIVVSAFIKIPIGVIPITLQTLAIILTSLILKEKAVYCVLLYVFMGLAGIPVFTNGGGLGYVMMPTFGYLLGFIACSYFVGRYQNDHWLSLFIRCCIGLLIIYAIGICYFAIVQYLCFQKTFTISYLLTTLCVVFIPGDLISIIAGISIYQRLSH